MLGVRLFGFPGAVEFSCVFFVFLLFWVFTLVFGFIYLMLDCIVLVAYCVLCCYVAFGLVYLVVLVIMIV